jgi:hypothetical protein
MAPTMEQLRMITSKEGIADLYVKSLGTPKTRVNHTLLKPPQTISPNVQWPVPSIDDIARDFTSWYAGFVSCVKGLDTQINLPATHEMVQYMGQNFEQAKDAIAA